MELNGYRLLLPEGTLDYFDLVDVKESVNEVVIYLEEKNIVPEKYTDQDTESKGFYDPVIVQDHKSLYSQYPDLHTSQERYFFPQGRSQLHLRFPSHQQDQNTLKCLQEEEGDNRLTP